ncbi:galactose mutarotase-like enzyme [Catalinimonas alkaloidigena]|uniref:aldose 1-epimerase family protein n=1 Tax=Catalinimonas alkaloidigena TaxID=1075417 RepID=UPI002406482F|nr:aldose 1-epimerase family protein [Catalinimonas alkaloidigena]MDF9800449.1 galactose mutarotase-like enzyme [Catalinimonas alkaloidigena]
MNYILENEDWEAQIKSEGAELCSFKNKKSGKEYIWQADPDVWARHAPVLFPIVGRLKDDQYRLEGKTYSMSQHGFARDRDFSLVEQEKASLRLGLTADHETMEKYPFNFVLDITYQLLENELIVSYSVSNKDQQPMPFSIGAHPAFTTPKIINKQMQEYHLVFDQAETLDRYLIKDGLQTGRTRPLLENEQKLPLHPKFFEDDAIVLKGVQSKWVSLVVHASGEKLVDISVEDFPYLGIWQKENSDFICIEPWLGIADKNDFAGDLSEKEGIQMIAPEKVFECSYKIKFH